MTNIILNVGKNNQNLCFSKEAAVYFIQEKNW